VTKISAYKFKSKEEDQADYFRKMLISMSRDIRVIMIKLADRMHNMRTLEFLDKERQVEIATETREIYAPLAHRFGMAKIKWELEDLSLKYVKPDVYRYLMERIDLTRTQREEYIQEIADILGKALLADGLTVDVTGRAKHFDSIYRKMLKRGKPFEEIYDLIAMRIVTRSIKDCYHALGVIHNLWTPVSDRFHDYIATPKQNMYQSLHTTVVGPNGRMIEIQIRTQAMHYVAEFGIAAHWLYKEGKHILEESDRQLSWLREVLDWQKDMTNPTEFMEYLKIDLFHDEVYVFTPDGELKHLPQGATALDFAFAIHSDVGTHCNGTKINGRLVPFDTPLKSGDEVAVMTSPHCEPSNDWLKICKTTSARSKIKKYLKQKGFEEALALGKEIFDRTIKKRATKAPSDDQILDAAMAMSFTSTEQMFAALGAGNVAINSIMMKLYPPEAEEPEEKSLIKKFVDRARGGKGIKVEGLTNMMFRFARCCQPVPGEKIIGFITRGRGLTIHRLDCVNAIIAAQEPERRVEVSWDVSPGQGFLVRLAVVVEYRKNILYDITEVISNTDAEVRGAELKSGEAASVAHFVVEIKNISHLNRVIENIRKKIKGVIKIDRALGGDAEPTEESN
jgi:GTP diphosphokinase / guanosine-3',5'-bis(diphosphate) 3'-diphosphatase